MKTGSIFSIGDDDTSYMDSCKMNAFHAFRKDVRTCGLVSELICSDGDCRTCNLPLWFIPQDTDDEDRKEKLRSLLTNYEESE